MPQITHFTMVNPMKYLSVCSGIEATSVAWEPLGWRPVGFSEIEAFPMSVLNYRFPNVINYGDLNEQASWPIEPGSVDVVAGGTPCQSFSTAGRRGGLKDPRGRVMLSYLELVERIRPRYLVWENVPGVLSSNAGRDFATFVGSLANMGYWTCWRVLDAQRFGVPQRRRRVFVVASLGDNRAAKVLFDGESRFGNPASSRASREDHRRTPADCSATVSSKWSKGSGGPAGDECQNLIPFRKSRRAQSTTDYETWVPATVSNTLNAADVLDRDTHGVVGTSELTVRRMLPVECERLQGLPDDWTLVPHRGKPAADGPRYRAIGNSMAVPVMRWIGARISRFDAMRT